MNYVENAVIHSHDEKTKSEVNAKNYYSNRGKTHDKWSIEQKELFKEICGEKMIEYGYSLPF